MNSEPHAPMTLEEFDRIAEQKLAERQSLGLAARYGIADEEPLLWVSFAPYWTADVAERVKFPASDPAASLEQLLRAGVVRVTQARTADGLGLEPPVYTVEDSVRAHVMEERAGNQAAAYRMRGLVARIGQQMRSAFDGGATAPPSLRRWAVLAAHAEDSAALVEEFNRCLEAAGRNSAEIIDWKNAAGPLSNLLQRDYDDSLKQALQRATRRLELIRRRENDEQHLTYFKEREEQRHAFEGLMRGPDHLWATHFIGAGGVGKTMLIRKIMAHWAEAEGATAARIDFDFLNAEYPSLAPGMLLWYFAQDLQAHAGEGAGSLFNQADGMLNRLSQQLRSERARGQSAPATSHPLFREAVGLYIMALRQIPGRILLIADTCEELTKGNSGLARQNVSETFRILMALHDGPQILIGEPPDPAAGLPGLRVIFSGRRPLASRGEGWSCPSASALEARPFLRLHEVRGFKKEEAKEFLTDIMEVPAGLTDAIVTRSSPDAGGSSVILYDDPAHQPSHVQRCNPYDLRLYAEWAKDTNSPPTVDDILHASSARYVELRIIQRLDYPPLEEMLPAVALLGHFDLDALLNIYPNKDPEMVNTAFEKLQVEEWINQRTAPGADGRTSRLVLDVDIGLRERLLAYFRQQSSSLEKIQQRAAAHLEEVTLQRDLSELDWSYFDAALRTLEADPDPLRAARWWKNVEARITAERPPEWVLAITTGLQHEGGSAALRHPDSPPDAPPESLLRPAIIALHAAALLNTAQRAAYAGEIGRAWREAAEVWKEVTAKAHLHPMAEEASRLKVRALAGTITSALAVGTKVGTEQLNRLRETLSAAREYFDDPQLALALVAAVEAIVENSEQEQLYEPVTAREFLADLFGAAGLTDALSRARWDTTDDSRDPERADKLRKDLRLLRAYVWCIAGRALKLEVNRSREVVACFDRSLQEVPEHRPALSAVWGDWLPPDDITARIRLEYVRALYPSDRPVAEVLKAIGQWEIKLYSIDSERLHAALLMLELALKPVPSQRLARFDLADSSMGRLVQPKERRLTPGAEICNAHRATPPLFVAAAEVFAANGQADEALALLGIALKNPTHYTLETLLHVERACARIVWRMRMQDIGEKAGEGLAASSDVGDMLLLWTLDALEGPKLNKGIPHLAHGIRFERPAPQPGGMLTRGEPPLNQLLQKRLDEMSSGRTASDSLEGNDEGEAREEYERNLLQLRQTVGWVHAIWQTRYALDDERARQALEWANDNLPQPLPFPVDDALNVLLAAVNLDVGEAAALASLQNKPFNIIDVDKATGDLQPELLAINLRTDAISREFVAYGDYHRKLVANLGIRQAAEIAWREGELLALRLPQKATTLLAQARHWFEECGDHVGVIVTGTALAMIYSRYDMTPGASAQMKVIEQAYEALRLRWNETQAGKLASLEELDALAAKAEGEEPPSDWAPRCWRPWLTRLMLCRRAVLKGSEESAATTTRMVVKRFLGLAYGKGTGNAELLPADLTLWASKPPPRPSLARRVRAAVSDFWKANSTYVEAALGFTIAAVVLYLFYKATIWLAGYVLHTENMSTSERIGFVALIVGWLVTTFRLVYRMGKAKPDPASPTLLGRWITTYPTGELYSGVVVVILLCTGAVYFSIKYYGSGESGLPLLLTSLLAACGVTFFLLYLLILTRMSKSYAAYLDKRFYKDKVGPIFKLEIAPSSEPAAETSKQKGLLSLTFGRSKFNPLLFQPPRRKDDPTIVFNYEATEAEPYARLSEKVLSTVEKELKSLHTTGRVIDKGAGLSPEVSIAIVEGRLNGPCWEALFPQASLNEAARRASYRLRYYRTVLNAPQRTPKLEERRNLLVSLTSGGIADLVAVESWELLFNFGLFYKWSPRPAELFGPSSSSHKAARILHLVGTPEETISGVRFNISTGSPVQFTSQSGVESMGDDAGMLRAEDLTRVLPELVLCVLQGEPSRPAPARTEGDRRFAAQARIFASKLHAQGVPAVLYIPPMDAKVASLLIRQLSEFLAEHKAQLITDPESVIASLPRVAAGMRETIADGAGDDAPDERLFETLMDVCLYVNR